MSTGRSLALRRFRPTPVANLPMRSQHAAEAGFAGDVSPFIRQHGDDPRRWQLGKSRLIGNLHNPLALVSTEGMGRYRPHGMWTPVPTPQAFAYPALQGTNVDPGEFASGRQSSTLALRLDNALCDHLAIFHECHSSSSLRWKIACSCFDSTNNAAVSASALSLRRRSRSSSLIRLRESRVS